MWPRTTRPELPARTSQGGRSRQPWTSEGPKAQGAQANTRCSEDHVCSSLTNGGFLRTSQRYIREDRTDYRPEHCPLQVVQLSRALPWLDRRGSGPRHLRHDRGLEGPQLRPGSKSQEYQIGYVHSHLSAR